MNCFVTGGSGFIGSNLVDRLLSEGHRVVAYDNRSTGQTRFLAAAMQNDRFRLIEGDILDLPALTSAMHESEVVYHLAANADVRFGPDHPRKDLDQNTIGTFNVLEAMRSNEDGRTAKYKL
jgi:UDP-glucose 4-epimerase